MAFIQLYQPFSSIFTEMIRSAFLRKMAVADINSWYHILWATILLKIKPVPTLSMTIIRMLNFLTDTIFVAFCGTVFQQTIGIPMGTNYALLSWKICSCILMMPNSFKSYCLTNQILYSVFNFHQ